MKQGKGPSLTTSIDHDVQLKSRYRHWAFGLGGLIILAVFYCLSSTCITTIC